MERLYSFSTLDSETVVDVAKKKNSFGIEKAIFVGDRGMMTIDNIKGLTSKEIGLGYIMALRHEEAKDLFSKRNVQLEVFDQHLPVYRKTIGLRKI